MKSIRVIINADDCGRSETVDAAIEECIKANAITSTTLMANGCDIDGAKKLYNQYKEIISFGCHITLDEGTPLVKSQILLDKGFLEEKDGVVCFTKKLWQKNLILGETKQAFIKEASAQIECLLDNRFEVSHFDSHHHVHTAKSLIWLMPTLCNKFGINKYRRIRNCMPKNLDFYVRQAWHISQRILLKRGKTTEYFGSYSDILKQKNLSFIENGATLEIMCHPGHEGANYQNEVNKLKGTPEKIPGFHVDLINYYQL